MDKSKKVKIIKNLKLERAARRAIEIELGLNKVHANVFLTHKKDKADKQSNTVKEWEDV